MSSSGYTDLLSSRQNSLYELSFLPALNLHFLRSVVFQVVATPKHGKTRKKNEYCVMMYATRILKSQLHLTGWEVNTIFITSQLLYFCSYRFSLASSRINVLILNCIQRLVYPAILERNTKRNKLHTVQCNFDLHWRKELGAFFWYRHNPFDLIIRFHDRKQKVCWKYKLCMHGRRYMTEILPMLRKTLFIHSFNQSIKLCILLMF